MNPASTDRNQRRLRPESIGKMLAASPADFQGKVQAMLWNLRLHKEKKCCHPIPVQTGIPGPVNWRQPRVNVPHSFPAPIVVRAVPAHARYASGSSGAPISNAQDGSSTENPVLPPQSIVPQTAHHHKVPTRLREYLLPLPTMTSALAPHSNQAGHLSAPHPIPAAVISPAEHPVRSHNAPRPAAHSAPADCAPAQPPLPYARPSGLKASGPYPLLPHF